MVWGGLSNRQYDSLHWLLPHKELSNRELLDSLLNGKYPLTHIPLYPLYGKLKSYLKQYNEIRIKGGWGIIPAIRTQYKLGDTGVVVSAIRRHLAFVGDIANDSKSNLFDEELDLAVRNYQYRFGLHETGKVNKTLINEMNVSVEKRIDQIIVNMERTRWVPANLSNDYLLVNIPDFKLFVYEGGVPMWNMNIVVGKSQHETVVFNGELKYIVFSPYWNIPASILKNEILPDIRRNSNFLARHNMEWNNGNLRQKPGPDNALGLVKFVFPNSHSIYLHDTPAKSLFSAEKRAFSHGCIRLAEAKRLAMYLLRNDPDWNEQKITEAMNKGVERSITLKKSLPVFISYFTSWVDADGKINFRQDVYKRDHRLAEMIMNKSSL